MIATEKKRAQQHYALVFSVSVVVVVVAMCTKCAESVLSKTQPPTGFGAGAERIIIGH